MSNIHPTDPVILGLCQQTDLDAAVEAAKERLAREKSVIEEQQADQISPPEESDDVDGEDRQTTISRLKSFRLSDEA